MKTKNLSLAEAHASGRKYRRAGWGEWVCFIPSTHVLLTDALATDYELEPVAKLLTREEVALVIWDYVANIAIEPILIELFGEGDDK